METPVSRSSDRWPHGRYSVVLNLRRKSSPLVDEKASNTALDAQQSLEWNVYMTYRVKGRQKWLLTLSTKFGADLLPTQKNLVRRRHSKTTTPAHVVDTPMTMRHISLKALIEKWNKPSATVQLAEATSYRTPPPRE